MADKDLIELLKSGIEVWNNSDHTYEADLSSADFSSLDLGEAQLGGADFSKSMLVDANLSNAYLQCAVFSDAFLVRANLERSVLLDADLQRADLRSANLRGAVLAGANLSGSNLAYADLRGADFDHNTQFNGCFTKGCKIDRYQLEQLVNYGGLTVGNRMVMRIEDGAARLQASYSGYLQWIHLVAMVVFVFPYAWFIIARWSEATFVPNEGVPHMPLWKALLTYIYNGGLNWKFGFDFHWSFLAFVYMFFYNLLRLLLLWKAKELELQQKITGLPSQISLTRSRWGALLKVSSWGFVLSALLTMATTIHFFTQEIPVHANEVWNRTSVVNP
ncbi:MAG: pentapeptide repeat-containing protein [Pseudomonadota bacterium]